MRPFHLNLEKVLKVRQMQTIKARQELATAQLAVGRAWFEAEQSRAGRMAAAGTRVAVGGTQEVTRLHVPPEARGLDERTAASRLQRAVAELAAKRAALQEAIRREGALQELRDQHAKAFSEGRKLDETAIALSYIEGQDFLDEPSL